MGRNNCLIWCDRPPSRLKYKESDSRFSYKSVALCKSIQARILHHSSQVFSLVHSGSHNTHSFNIWLCVQTWVSILLIYTYVALGKPTIPVLIFPFSDHFPGFLLNSTYKMVEYFRNHKPKSKI